ncbi:aldehyde dehydrogenase family protein [soil metagenome]
MESSAMQAATRRWASRQFLNIIDGERVPSDSSFDVLNPATGLPVAQAPDATREELDMAVDAARTAQPAWAALGAAERRQRMLKLAEALLDNQEELASLITLEQGKPLVRARDEVFRATQHLKKLVMLELPTRVLRDDETGRVEVRYRPLGVVGAIAPWNMPLGMGMTKVSHSLYTGNTVVLKPSPYTPLATLRMGELARDLFPAGVLNVVSGGNALGQWMSEHRGIDKISFTGSVPTGKKVMASAAGTLKRVTLELGGNDAAIVMDDANLDTVVPGIFKAAFVNSGQICMAIKRIYVPEALHDEFVARMAQMARDSRIDDGFVDNVDYGPVQNAAQYRIVLDLIADARRAGGTFVCGGNAVDRPGYFIQPTVVTGLADDSRLVVEEQFGPVVPVMSYRTEDEAVKRANASRLGLAGSVWGTDLARAAQVAGQIDTGTMWLNRHGGADTHVPFGGAKESGIGQEFGIEGLASYSQILAIHVR